MNNQKFDFALSWKKIAIYVMIFLIILIHPYFVSICFVFLTIYSVAGRRQALESLFFSEMIKYANPVLIAFPSNFGFYTWGIIFIACFSLLARSRYKNSILILITVFYVTVLCLSVWSKYPLISVLKSSSFYFVVFSVLSGSLSMKHGEFVELSQNILNFFMAILLLSFPTYLYHNIGFVRNGRGFQGILNHPQAFGIFWSPICTFLFIRIFFMKNVKNVIVYFLMFSGIFISMLLSKSRTSVISFLLSFLLLVIIFKFRKSIRQNISIKKGIFLSYAAVVILFLTFYMSSTFSTAVFGFITKGQNDLSISEAFEHSRGRGVDNHFENFLKSPWVGHGFGVDPASGFETRIKYLMGIPVSAASEKGIVYTAVLEEIGIIGTLIFLLFLSFLTFKVLYADALFIGMYFSCLLVNIGEAVLFSVNGGLHYWVLIGLCVSSSVHSSYLLIDRNDLHGPTSLLAKHTFNSSGSFN